VNNETTNASPSNRGSKRVKLTLKQHLEIEYVEDVYREEPRRASTGEVPEHLIALLKRLHEFGVFDTHQPSSFDEDVRSSSPRNEVDADLIELGSIPEEESEQYPKRSAEDWPIPGTDCVVKICASPEGPGELAPRDTTPTYALAKALVILRMLLQQGGRLKCEPVTLKAVDIPSAA